MLVQIQFFCKTEKKVLTSTFFTSLCALLFNPVFAAFSLILPFFTFPRRMNVNARSLSSGSGFNIGIKALTSYKLNELNISILFSFLLWVNTALSPYISALEFFNSPVWNIQFDELDFFPSLNWIFLPAVACKIQVWNRIKIQFIKLDISNWRIVKNQVQIDRRYGLNTFHTILVNIHWKIILVQF